MTQNLAINSAYDLYLGADGNIVMNSGVDAVMQACQTAAQAQLGEMVLAIDNGIPNFQTIWQSQRNVAQFEAYLRRALLAVDQVTDVQNLTVRVQNNTLSYTAIIKSTYGNGVING